MTRNKEKRSQKGVKGKDENLTSMGVEILTQLFIQTRNYKTNNTFKSEILIGNKKLKHI